LRLLIVAMIALKVLLLAGCSAGDDRSGERSTGGMAERPAGAIASVYTELSGSACHSEVDKNDPNETPYLRCPGAAGYALIVRRVDAGRQSIDVVDPTNRGFPLDYQEFVTRHMFTLNGKAEWRLLTKGATQVPIALIAIVQAREDNENPEKVTRSFVAVAKITPGAACVTDSFTVGSRSEAEVRRAADTAQERECAKPQPAMAVDGVNIR